MSLHPETTNGAAKSDLTSASAPVSAVATDAVPVVAAPVVAAAEPKPTANATNGSPKLVPNALKALGTVLGEVKRYELESAATALPDGGDAIIKHRFAKACELVDVTPVEDCTVIYARFGTKPGRELAEGETVAGILAKEPFSPEAGAYMILTVRNDESRIRTVGAVAHVRGEHGPEVVDALSAFASSSGSASASASLVGGAIGSKGITQASQANQPKPSIGQVTPNPTKPSSLAAMNASLKKKAIATDPKPRPKRKPSPSASPRTSKKHDVKYEACLVTAPEGKTLVAVSYAQAEALVDALESSMPIQDFLRPSLAVTLYEDAPSLSVFPGDVAVALTPSELESLRDAENGEHLTDLPDVLLALQVALQLVPSDTSVGADEGFVYPLPSVEPAAEPAPAPAVAAPEIPTRSLASNPFPSATSEPSTKTLEAPSTTEVIPSQESQES